MAARRTTATEEPQTAEESVIQDTIGPETSPETPPADPFRLPSLAGVMTEDLVETIGTGKYAARYVNWSRTLNLLRSHAPGWLAEAVPAGDGSLVHRAPGVGGYLAIRFIHLDGRQTPVVPQAVMDNRNNAIPYDKITARDVTDTHRRGVCLAAAFFFGLAYELWAKQPLESGFASSIEDSDGSEGVRAVAAATSGATAAPQSAVTREEVLEACLAKGLSTYAAEDLLGKLNGKYAGAIARLNSKDEKWVKDYNALVDPKNDAKQF